ncbi:transglycosylase SLT domain-containing protein [Castellaniella sp. GW247-6E4]|uniref:lytic transglycosylase domain-containing protein n=1 Tax=Castellaniella sp. GW247-6E4 TaxID=3140380 RepID=UPI003315EF46
MAIALGLAGCAGAKAPAAPEAAPIQASAPQASRAVPSTPAPVRKAAPYVPPVVPEAARQAVVDAYEAMQKKRWTEVDRLAAAAAADPVLGIYPRYWSLRQRLSDRTLPVPEAEVQQFLADNTDAYLADRIKGDWILAAVRAGDYGRAQRIGPVVDNSSRVACAQLLAAHMSGRKARAAEVLEVYQPNSDCWDMLDQVAEDHVLSRNQLAGLLRDTLETGKDAHARRVAAIVFDTPAMVQYAALMKNPRKWLEQQTRPRNRIHAELTAIALSRLAREDDRMAAARDVEGRWAGLLPKADLEWVWGQFGLVAALNVDPDAARWYRKSGFVPMTDYNHAWEVRAELREAKIDWGRVATAIRKMSARQADEPVWRYWYGRALAAQGNQKAARQYYESIATDLSFYGQLANEELGRAPYMPTQPAPVEAALVQDARADQGLERAIALFDLGWRREAVPEWNFALRGMDDRQLRAAAELARQEHIYDRVVNTSLRTRDEVDFSQRFIAPFEGQVAAKARLIDLDPAWVYGLIRQESRFITDARSRVGASGLMQLMPATARWVARKIGMKDFKLSEVNDFDTNTVLGTQYLNMVLRDLDGSELLATAGYNAGPGRPKRWRARLQAPVEGAIFAETIPFTETRLYVKNVMSNAVYYGTLFSGQPQSLKQRLGTVAPVPGTRSALP